MGAGMNFDAEGYTRYGVSATRSAATAAEPTITSSKTSGTAATCGHAPTAPTPPTDGHRP